MSDKNFRNVMDRLKAINADLPSRTFLAFWLCVPGLAWIAAVLLFT